MSVQQQHIKIDKEGSIFYYNNGRLHRDDGPAVEQANGVHLWIQNGLIQNIEYTPAFKTACEITPSDSLVTDSLTNEIKYIKIVYGEKYYYKDSSLTIIHRNDGPAYTGKDGEMWYINGKIHRTDGPALLYPNGSEAWFKDGLIHRDGGPAVTDVTGTKVWYSNNKRHRTDGPAIEDSDGGKFWYIEGKIHREDGPAIEYADGYKAWYTNGELDYYENNK